VSLGAVFYYMLAPPLMPPSVHALLAFVTTPETQKKKAPTRGEREQRYISKDSSRLSSSLVGMAGLQEDMAGPSQSNLECLKILHPGMYAEKLVSDHFLFAESDLLGFAIRNELVPLSSYVDLCERRSCWLRLPRPSEVFENSSFV
jgi:hypothetical protein